MTYAEQKPTLDSDYMAFRHKHPRDNREETIVGECADGSILRRKITFEVFAFHAPEIGAVVFDVRGIKDALLAGKLTFCMYEAELNADWVNHVRTNNGVEAECIASLTSADLERPGIMVLWPDGQSTLIDGNNRLVRRWDDGLRTFRFANVAVSRELVPFMCEPGDEEKFIDREDAERGLTPLTRLARRI